MSNQVQQHVKYHQLTQVLKHLANEHRVFEHINVCDLPRFLSTDTIMVEAKGVEKILTPYQYRELQCKVTAYLF